jgi:hypothetical protein
LKFKLKDETKFCSNELIADILDAFNVNNKRDYLAESESDVEKIYSNFKS